ncbi:VIT domain-containing protein [Qipengyuania sp. ASV99]|uniref:VIT domain-containing protein n=1 Tax=Qipengyuania sp. ASV99 TaxID=3399681 RepID=UPI003A4C54AC
MSALFRALAIMTAALLAAGTLAAQSNPLLANPSLRALVGGVEDGSERGEIVLSELTVSIDQHGAMAEVQIDARLTNPTDNEIEARFSMQLPHGAVLTGYSLDIDGVMIPGSLIDQPRAQQVYEDEVRGNIDPGLAEISRNNAFSTRINPVAPEGSRRISLSFVTHVSEADGLIIPLNSVGPVGVFRLQASVTGVASAPVLILAGAPPTEFQHSGRDWVLADYRLSETRLAGDLQLSGAAPDRNAMAMRHSNGRTFFAISDQIAATDLSLAPPQRVRIYWDVSRSRADALLDAERALLSSFLGEFAPSDIDVVSFSSGAPQLAHFSGGEASAVDEFLAARTYRGATSFAGLNAIAAADADLCLIFSDGGNSLDPQVRFQPDCPLFIVASGPNVDATRISRLADDTAGAALYLGTDNRDQTLAQMRKLPVGVTSIRDASGQRLSYRTLPAGEGQWSVVGELGDEHTINVHLSGTNRRERRKAYTINPAHTVRGDAAGALWAAQEVERLSDDPSDREKMQALSQSFQVASPTMAFLVLERPDQYVSAEIAPPDGFGEEWRRQYRTAKAEHDRASKSEREERLAYVVREWEQTRQWWSAKYDQAAAMRTVDAAPGATDLDAEAEIAFEPPPPTAMMLREDAGPAPNEAAFADDEVIVVTASRREEIDQYASADIAASALDRSAPEAAVRNDSAIAVQVDLASVLNERPYLSALDLADARERLPVLATQEQAYGSLPGFYFDVAEWFRLKGDAALARQLLLSALDLSTSDDETLLIVAFRLERDGDHDTAVQLLEALASRIDYRPQPKRILALALAARARGASGDARRSDLERAFRLLAEVVLDPADDRYAGLETVALMELNALIPLIEAVGGTWALDERLIARLDVDIRVVVEWTSPDADLDLWVREPSGEQASYSNPRTALGGKLSNDMTDGYGPEEYVLRNAYPGSYQVRVQGFSGDRINPNGPGRAMVRLIRAFARDGQSEQLIDAEIGFDRSNPSENDRVVATIQVAE